MSDISGNSRSPADRIKWIVILILVIAVGALVLILLREDPRQFTIRIPTSPGESIEVSFEGRSANIIDILDCILKGRDPPPEEETGSSMKEATYRGCDKSSNFDPKIAKLALAEHGYYRVPSPEAGMAIRDLPEAESQFAEIVRSALYNLEGPFTIPYTFRKADAKLLDALADLYREEPSHPLIVTLWEWSLNLENVFFPPKIKVTLRPDKSKPEREATACAEILQGKHAIVGMLYPKDAPESKRLLVFKEIDINDDQPVWCWENLRTRELLQDKAAFLSISQSVYDSLLDDLKMANNGQPPAPGRIDAFVTPFPKNLSQ